MQTYLYLHKENTGLPQEQYQGEYPLRHADYELSRSVNRRGEIASGVCGGEIRVVIDGFAQAALLGWVFDSFRKENGTIETIDEHEKTIAKLHFTEATVKNFRISYDSRVKNGVATLLTVEAREIITDNDLHFENT